MTKQDGEVVVDLLPLARLQLVFQGPSLGSEQQRHEELLILEQTSF